MNYKDKYNVWKQNITDKELIDELNSLDEVSIEDAFYRDLAFGTGGLRGILGVGTNRMNIYVVAKASQGLANYINNHYSKPSVVIGYDTRIKSNVFSKVAAEVLSNNNIKVNIYSEPLPVPMVSFAVRQLKCSAGIMITASHNPAKYNGYKVFGDDGCQITNNAASEILQEINKVNEFEVERKPFENNSLINYIENSVIDKYIYEVKKQSFLYDEEINKNINIVYTPLNGTGLKPITRSLKELGYKNIITVKEQETPNGNFPTCPYPNPEIKETLTLGIKYAKENNADILIATDPDSDRVGIAIKENDDFVTLSGNELGVLLFNYICEQKSKHNGFGSNPVLIKTIVTTNLADKIAKKHGIETIDVLTGFKYIGEQISLLEKNNRLKDFVFSFEESFGYLSGSHVRDKDGVNGACIVCEMFAYYKTRNISLKEKLNQIYEEFGYFYSSLESYEFLSAAGFEKMQTIMKIIREKPLKQIGEIKVIDCIDYLQDSHNLPKADVIKYYIEGGGFVAIRPSGTEPKLKVYINVCSKTLIEAETINGRIIEYLKDYFK